jgi:hypothetical protein
MQRRAAQMQAAGHGGELSLEDVIEDLLGAKKKELKALFERTGDFDAVWDGIVAAFREEIAKATPIEQADRRQEQAHGIAETKPPSPPRPPKIPLPKQMRVNPRKLEAPNVRTEKPPRLNTGVPNEK